MELVKPPALIITPELCQLLIKIQLWPFLSFAFVTQIILISLVEEVVTAQFSNYIRESLSQCG